MRIKLQAYAAAIIATVFLLVIWQLLAQWQFSVSVSPLDTEILPIAPSPSVLPVTKPTSTSSSNPMSTPARSDSVKTDSNPGALAGTLRVSNRTAYPIRLALLQKSTAKSSKQPVYGAPAHWDFAPSEGGSRGLTLALPDGNLKLNRGDIIVAFAQDGSRRYWGPYVVGDTAAPIRNNNSEWQLILQN